MNLLGYKPQDGGSINYVGQTQTVAIPRYRCAIHGDVSSIVVVIAFWGDNDERAFCLRCLVDFAEAQIGLATLVQEGDE